MSVVFYDDKCEHNYEFIGHVNPRSDVKMHRCSKCNHTKCDDHRLGFDYKIMNAYYYSCRTCGAKEKR